jgi:hypothetical protein
VPLTIPVTAEITRLGVIALTEVSTTAEDDTKES